MTLEIEAKIQGFRSWGRRFEGWDLGFRSLSCQDPIILEHGEGHKPLTQSSIFYL